MKAVMHFDGGCRGNPGPSSSGVVLDFEDGERIEVGQFQGHLTNNESEYLALILGLKLAIDEDITDLEIIGDSRLVAEHVNGTWECKADSLKPFLEEVWQLAESFQSISIKHVSRKFNKDADRICNEILDLEAAKLSSSASPRREAA